MAQADLSDTILKAQLGAQAIAERLLIRHYVAPYSEVAADYHLTDAVREFDKLAELMAAIRASVELPVAA